MNLNDFTIELTIKKPDERNIFCLYMPKYELVKYEQNILFRI